MKVSKSVRQKLFEDKNGRFSGTECHASALFARMVSALQTAFVTEDIGFAPLFLLDDATDPARTGRHVGHSYSLGVDPHDAIGDFNAALKAARTRATLLDEDVKALFIKALDTVFYQPVVSRLLLHDQRAAHDLLTIQQWAPDEPSVNTNMLSAVEVPDGGAD
ncbi:hypothetical protein CYMTET_53164 [Cymbomonas tetramitiformis]|uniref:Uncharacterized protein n=1 Tax=Cymbomonas tetramitiformis TaxID=36881 RepID=A0AAE0BJC6_9CHLO|nr:hypothetical protein CYMTET_53164 [Cymbomonas tetramitiformis]